MASFLFSLSLFYGLSALSTLAAVLLFVSLQRERRNLLLRSCSFLLILMYAMILAGHINHQGQADIKDGFCEAQSIFLNYCYICVHAHLCFMMLNSCQIAMGWRLWLLDDVVEREWALMLMAFALPLISLLFLIYLYHCQPDSVVIYPRAFFCVISEPVFWTLAIWIMVFALPGSLLSVCLLYKTWRARQKMLLYGTVTQITLPYLFRLLLSTLVYLCIAFGSFVPLLIMYDPPELKPIPRELLPASSLRSPWTNPGLCASIPSDPALLYYRQLLCPTFLSFLPAVMGIVLFLMYGFGTHARNAYRNMIKTCLPIRRRRPSAMPLVDGGTCSSTMSMTVMTEKLVEEERETVEGVGEQEGKKEREMPIHAGEIDGVLSREATWPRGERHQPWFKDENQGSPMRITSEMTREEG